MRCSVCWTSSSPPNTCWRASNRPHAWVSVHPRTSCGAVFRSWQMCCKCCLGWILWRGFPLWGLASVSPWQNRHPVGTSQPAAAPPRGLLPSGGTFRGPGGSHRPQKPTGGGLPGSGGDPHPWDLLSLHVHWRMAAGPQWRTPWHSALVLLALHRPRSG